MAHFTCFNKGAHSGLDDTIKSLISDDFTVTKHAKDCKKCALTEAKID